MLRKLISATLAILAVLLLYNRRALVMGLNEFESIAATYGIIILAIITGGISFGLWPKKERPEEDKKTVNSGIFLILLSVISLMLALIFLLISGNLT